jgi:hypothetical protein
MVLDLNSQIGNRFDDSTTNVGVHLFEFHSKTATWGLVILGVITVAVFLIWYCIRKRYARRSLQRNHHLATLYEGCTCKINMRELPEIGEEDSLTTSSYKGKAGSFLFKK